MLIEAGDDMEGVDTDAEHTNDAFDMKSNTSKRSQRSTGSKRPREDHTEQSQEAKRATKNKSDLTLQNLETHSKC